MQMYANSRSYCIFASKFEKIKKIKSYGHIQEIDT